MSLGILGDRKSIIPSHFPIESSSAFSLIELLVVLAIIGVLAGILLPSLGRAKQSAWSISCLNNLKQIGVASLIYSDENDDSLPVSEHERRSWMLTLQESTGGTILFKCPKDGKKRLNSYATNDNLLPPKTKGSSLDFSRLTSIPAPSETFYMTECSESYFGTDHFHFDDATPDDVLYFFADQVAALRHQGAANFLFIDGHTSRISWQNARTMITERGSRFIFPSGSKP